MESTTLASLREQRRDACLARLRQGVQAVLGAMAPGQREGHQVWLFGSWARGDWDAYSDVDLLAVAPEQVEAEALADALRQAALADDVIALSQERWQQRQSGADPWWRGICRDAIPLAGGSQG
jgi:predicted nucleotidyltransferase